MAKLCQICGSKIYFWNACSLNNKTLCGKCYDKEKILQEKKLELKREEARKEEQEIFKEKWNKSKKEYNKKEEELAERGFWYWLFHSNYLWVVLIGMLFFKIGGIIGILVGILISYLHYITIPKATYECEKCNKQFHNPKKCREHEKTCNKKQKLL